MEQTAINPIYKVTGVDRSGKRFKIRTGNYIYMLGINVWQGSKWESKDGGNTWKLLFKVLN